MTTDASCASSTNDNNDSNTPARSRQLWLEQHADVFPYRDELARQVASRRQALGLQAVATQPPHLVDLLGPVPDDSAARTRWARTAGRVEAYREQWAVDPQDLHQAPVDGVQYRQWTAAVETPDMLRRLDTIQVERCTDRSLGIEL